MRCNRCYKANKSSTINTPTEQSHHSLFLLPALKRQRAKAAHALVHDAQLLHQIEQELVDRLALLQQVPRDVLVVGAGGVITTQWLLHQWPTAHVTVHDYSQQLLDEHARALSPQQAKQIEWQCGAPAQLALADESCDLVFSNLYLPWTDQADLLLTEFWRVLRTRGGVHFSTLGPDTFRELDAAWRQVDAGVDAHVAQFPDMHDVGDALVQAGFKEPVMDREALRLTYSSARSVWTDLRRHGVHNAFSAQRPGLTGRTKWQQLCEVLMFDTLSNQTTGAKVDEANVALFALSLEWVMGQAWKDPRLRQQQQADGSIAVPLGRLFEDT